MKVALYDTLPFNEKTNTALSYRDGVLEYYGSELGIEPQDKVFIVYRSPATVSNSALIGLNSLPVTDGHVSLDTAIDDSKIVGDINNTKIVDYKNNDEKSTLAIQNMIALNQKGLDIKKEKEELSLGYHANLVKDPTNVYDFLQENIRPHHLAIVDKGRNGKNIRFIDSLKVKTTKENNMELSIYDADGDTPNFQMIMELVQQLPEALSKLPIKEVQKLVPILQKIDAQIKAETTGDDAGADAGDGDSTSPADNDADTQPPVDDAQVASDDTSLNDSAVNFKDTKEFSDAVSSLAKTISDKAIQDHAFVTTKAKSFLDDKYSFIGKDLDTIMLDAVKTQYEDIKFSDTAELKVLFKHLKPQSKYKDFGAKGSQKEEGFIDIKGVKMGNNNKENI